MEKSRKPFKAEQVLKLDYSLFRENKLARKRHVSRYQQLSHGKPQMMLNLVNDSDRALFPRQEPVTFSPKVSKMTTKVNYNQNMPLQDQFGSPDVRHPLPRLINNHSPSPEHCGAVYYAYPTPNHQRHQRNAKIMKSSETVVENHTPNVFQYQNQPTYNQPMQETATFAQNKRQVNRSNLDGSTASYKMAQLGRNTAQQEAVRLSSDTHMLQKEISTINKRLHENIKLARMLASPSKQTQRKSRQSGRNSQITEGGTQQEQSSNQIQAGSDSYNPFNSIHSGLAPDAGMTVIPQTQHKPSMRASYEYLYSQNQQISPAPTPLTSHVMSPKANRMSQSSVVLDANHTPARTKHGYDASKQSHASIRRSNRSGSPYSKRGSSYETSEERVTNASPSIKSRDSSPSKYFQQSGLREFFKKRSAVSKPQYRETESEIQQRGEISKLFAKFDYDQSGGLDAKELTALFKENMYDFNEDQVRQLYGGGDINVTVESLENINKNKEDLKRFRVELSSLKNFSLTKLVKKKMAQNMQKKRGNNSIVNAIAKKMNPGDENVDLAYEQNPFDHEVDPSPMSPVMDRGRKFTRPANNSTRNMLSPSKKRSEVNPFEMPQRRKKCERTYIPTTFDGLMVDFSQTAERKQIWNEIAQGFKDFSEEDLTHQDAFKMSKKIQRAFAKPMEKIIEVNKPFQHDIATSENKLYRKLLAAALEEKRQQDLQALQIIGENSDDNSSADE